MNSLVPADEYVQSMRIDGLDVMVKCAYLHLLKIGSRGKESISPNNFEPM